MGLFDFTSETKRQMRATNSGLEADDEIKALVLAKAKAAMAAKSRLYGGPDGSNNGVDWNPQQFPDHPMATIMGNTTSSYPDWAQQGPQRAPMTAEGLMGAGVPPEQAGNLMNGGPGDAQAQRDALLRRANPDAFMAADTSQAVLAPALKDMTPEQRAAFRLNPGEASKTYADRAFPAVPATIQTINALNAAVTANGGKDDPRAAPYIQQLKVLNKQTDEDMARLAEVKSQTAQHIGSAALDAARVKQIDAGNISDDDMTDLVGRYIQSGDKTLMTTLNRGTSGPANLARFQSEVNKQLATSGKSQRDIEDVMNGIKSAGSTMTAFAKGKQGDLTRSMNVALSHMATLDALGEALDNGDVNLVNKLKNTLSNQLGGIEIAGYEAAAPLVGDEVAKAILGGNSALADREKFAAPLTSARGTPARKAATNTFRGLLVGQLHGLKRQYETGTGLKDFDERLDPDVRALLGNSQFAPGNNPTQPNSAVTPVITIAPAPSARTANTVYQTPKGPLLWTGTEWQQPPSK